jgi:sugar transferase (PEP-CTERM/EpsH1 system associated)
MKNRIHICHVIFRLDYGGLENGLINLINKLPSEKYVHSIICLKYASDFKKRIQRDDVVVYELNKSDGKDIQVYFKIWRLFRSLKPDIVHTRNLPTIDMLLPALLAGIKTLIHSEHGLDASELYGSHKKYNRLRWLSQFLVDTYICVSRDLVNWLTKQVNIPKDKVTLIYNGVDTEKFKPLKPPSDILPTGFSHSDAFIIGTIGRLAQVKDQITLVKAFIKMLQQRPELRSKLRLVIAGEGQLRSEIESLLSSSGAEELAWLPGFYSNTADLLRCFDLFVLPSRREGISNTVLEAMASELPVVATDVGGNPEIIETGKTGLLVASENPDILANTLLKYVDNPALVSQHGLAGRQSVVKLFSLKNMVDSYDRLYTQKKR